VTESPGSAFHRARPGPPRRPPVHDEHGLGAALGHAFPSSFGRHSPTGPDLSDDDRDDGDDGDDDDDDDVVGRRGARRAAAATLVHRPPPLGLIIAPARPADPVAVSALWVKGAPRGAAVSGISITSSVRICGARV